MENAKPSPSGGRYPSLLGALIVASGTLSAIIYWLNFRLGQLLPLDWQATSIHIYLALFALLSLLYLGAVGLVLKCRPTPSQFTGVFFAIMAFAVIFRLLLVVEAPAALSGDMYRFIWDGRVQQVGTNPYRYPPADEALQNLRDTRIYPHINRKTARTIYPAGAQLFFRAVVALVGDSVTGFKSALVACDLAALAVMVALLRVHGVDPNRVLIYAWNPLVVFEIAYSGHLEAITVLFMVAAFFLTARRRKLAGTVLLALASAIKLYPGLLLPSILGRAERIKGPIIFAVAFGLLYLPYMDVGGKLMGFLPIYLKNPYESFNLGLKTLMLHFFPGLDYYRLSLVLLAGLLAVALVVLFKEKNHTQALFYGYVLTGWLLILMPAALHPWYVILIIPFLTVYPHPAWLIFSCTVALSYWKYVTPRGIMPTWVLLSEYLPLAALLAAGWAYRRLSGGSVVRNANPVGAGR
jgi:alpha-1,6-mannosyltransferase